MEKLTNWKILGLFIKNRFMMPFNHPTFLFYFISIILLVGSIGVLTDLAYGIKYCFFNVPQFTINASNIFITLMAASAVELILISKDDLDYPYRKSDVQILGISFLIVGFLLWMLAVFFKDNWTGVVTSVIGLLMAYFFWWISNAGNKTLVPSDSPASPVGGNKPVNSQLEGDTEGFKT